MIICVDRYLVRIVVKNDNGNITMINHFLKAYVCTEFYYKKGEGWMRINE